MTNKKIRNKNKQKNIKDVEERIEIVKEAFDKLEQTHLIGWDDEKQKYYSGFEGIEELLKILEEYKKPNILSGFSGIISVPELNRNIEYILPLKRNTGHGIRLVSMDKKDYVV